MDGRRKIGTARHAGVILLERALPSGGVSWVARYMDPDTKRKRQETLPAVLTTSEQRAAWARRKSGALKEREGELASGAPAKKDTALEEALKRFLQAKRTARAKTLRGYADAIAAMLAWASAQRPPLERADDVKGEHLMGLRDWLINKPRRQPARGKGKRYAQVETGRARSPHSVNRELRALKTCLEHVRRLGLVPMLTRDAITDNLKRLETASPEPEYLKPSVLLKIIEAAKRHDAMTWTLTREEKEAGVEEGSTPRFQPIAPYVAFVLLSGMREGEARSLRWDRVDLDAPPAGKITLRPEDVKTKRGRTVDLVVSPLLHEVLSRMKLRAGDATFVFGDAQDEQGNTRPALTRETVEAARRRLFGTFGAPHFTWQRCRVTCATFLANAPGIFGAASAFREAKQLGHSVVVAERHYEGVVHVDSGAKTLEAAMSVDARLRDVLGLSGAGHRGSAAAAT